LQGEERLERMKTPPQPQHHYTSITTEKANVTVFLPAVLWQCCGGGVVVCGVWCYGVVVLWCCGTVMLWWQLVLQCCDVRGVMVVVWWYGTVVRWCCGVVWASGLAKE
jgi:hypothetical protein